MCKYCDKDSLKKMHAEVDAILSEEYSDSTEDRLVDALKGYSVFTVWGCEWYTFYFLDGTYWNEDNFAKWRVPFKHCPMYVRPQACRLGLVKSPIVTCLISGLCYY